MRFPAAKAALRQRSGAALLAYKRLISAKAARLSKNLFNKELSMKKNVCDLCGYVYDEAAGDPEHGVAPGTKFADLPAEWECPLCGAGKSEFSEEK